MSRQLSRRSLLRALACSGAVSLVGLGQAWRSASASSEVPQEIHPRSQARASHPHRVLRHQIEADRF